MTAPPHIAFLGTSRSGLGHLRRICTIAGHLAALGNPARLTLVTNAEPAGLTARDMACFSRVEVRDRADMSAYLSQAGVSLAVLDTMKMPGIGAYGGPAALILRETPPSLVETFRRDDGRPWDCVIVPNATDHWMPSFGTRFARRAEAAGWIVRATGHRCPNERSAGIVLATGGGGTQETRALLYPMLTRVIERARQQVGREFRVRQALGPRAGAQALPGVDEVFDPGGALNAAFRAADLVISTAGYNSVLELATTDTPAMLVPIPRSLDDQPARVRLWGPRLGVGLLPGAEEEAAVWLARRIEQPGRRAPVDLGPDGAVRAADILRDMLCPVS